MAIGAYFFFFLKNYLRSHRYLREIVLIFIFHIFFWGFLNTDKPEDSVWTVFGVLCLLLNMVTVPSIFFLEKGNSLFFSLVRPFGRLNFFLSKLLLILIIDLSWIGLFTVIYGIRFFDANYFLLLFPRLGLITLLMLLSISILSLSFSYKPWIVWVLMLLIVFGGILNKSTLFPPHSIKESYALVFLILPPILEIIFSAVNFKLITSYLLFLLIAVGQIGFYLFLNIKFIMRKDFV